LLLILWILSRLIRCVLFFIRSMSLLNNLPILLLFVSSSFFARVTVQLRTSLINILLFGICFTLDPQLPPTTCQSCRHQTATLELHRTYNFLTRLHDEFEPLRAQLLAHRPYVSLMDALIDIRNEEIHLCDAGLLQSTTILVARSLVGHSSSAHHLSHLRLFLLLLVMRVVVFTVITVVVMGTWRHSAIGRRKLRRLRLAILHRVLVVLVLEDLRGVLLVQRYRRFSCCFVTLRPLHRQELLVL
jgi:hypothetical protein